jgi:predicted nucleotidyltransferase
VAVSFNRPRFQLTVFVSEFRQLRLPLHVGTKLRESSKNKLNLKKKKNMQAILENRKDDLKSICQTLKVKRLYAFGSVLSDNFQENSDIDFLMF